MDATDKIRTAWERSARGLAKRPELGRIARTVTARLTDGLTCAIEAEGHRLVADAPAIVGGNDRGASPTLLLEASLASCLATGYRIAFAARGLPVSDIEVQVTGTFDVCGQYGLEGGKLGFDGPVTYAVCVESPADEEAVVGVLDWVDAHSPLTNILRNPVELRRDLRITRSDD
jgi:uncharacterized OsmC-like protein